VTRGGLQGLHCGGDVLSNFDPPAATLIEAFILSSLPPN
jgi:hypothetical protein